MLPWLRGLFLQPDLMAVYVVNNVLEADKIGQFKKEVALMADFLLKCQIIMVLDIIFA